MYKQRDDVDDKTLPVTVTIDSRLFHNLKEFRKEHGLKSLSKRINDLVWDWLNDQIKEKGGTIEETE